MFQLNYGTKKIFYTLQLSERKTLSIEVYPDCSVKVLAPNNTTNLKIEEVLVKRSAWIIKQQIYFQQFLPSTPEKEYVSGETHYYLGRSYLLKVVNGNRNQVKLKGRYLYVYNSNQYNQNNIKNAMTAWYYKHAEKKFNEILNENIKKFSEYHFNIPQLRIRKMKNRWGSCNSLGSIIINPEIIKAPSKCIEYVIIHEICHLIEKNHSTKFYKILSEKMPNWEKWKKRLEEVMA